MFERYVPQRAFFEPEAMEYSLGKDIYDKLEKLGVTIQFTNSHNRVTGIPGKSSQEGYSQAKQTLVVGVRKSLDFATCKPSANYQLPLATSCPGMCEYCYLATTLGKKPYLRMYVNVDSILAQAEKYIAQRAPEVTVFEGAATSDPIPTEYLSGSLFRTIEFFGKQPLARFRFVTKFTDIESLLGADHRGHTRFRFSINAPVVVRRYEHRTPGTSERIKAAAKVAQAGFPIGFIIAPIFVFPGWQSEYEALLKELAGVLSPEQRGLATFECITHRFTQRAKNQIMDVFPNSILPLTESDRVFKYGQFGYGKYVYSKELMTTVKLEISSLLDHYFPDARVEYIV